jgi:urease accessory protein
VTRDRIIPVDGTTAAPIAPIEIASRPRLFDGVADVSFARRGEETVLAHLHQKPPLRVLFPRTDDPLPLAVLANTAGGLVGGDRMATDVRVGAGAAVRMTAQAAEKVYRSLGAETVVDNRLHVQEGAWLEWLPQETIVFDRARLRRRLRIELAADARVLAGEILVFGRVARDERVTTGLLHDAWEVRRDGRLAWADALHLDADIQATLAAAAAFGGGLGYATMIYAAPDGAAHLDALRGMVGEEGAATCIGSMLIARWLSTDPYRVRQSFGRAWCSLRQHVRGLPAQLPPIWYV